MITIVAKSTVKEGKTEEFKALARKLVSESQKEDGCISYDLYQDRRNSNVFAFIEVWKDQDALTVHDNSKHFTEIVPKLSELREKPTEVNLYELA